MNQLYVKTSKEWRAWLSNNHAKEKEVWLIFFKKDTGKPSISCESAVEEALCFGWIDSIIKKIDDSKYARKFTPRKENSEWSEINKKRVTRLINDGRMTEYGLALIDAAKKSGIWMKVQKPPTIKFDMSPEFEQALDRNKKAKEFFNQLAPTYQKQYILWITIAKRQETKEKRIRESIELLEKGQKLGLK